MNFDIAMIAADTTRTRAYLSSMARHDVLPRYILLLQNSNNTLLPGQYEGLEGDLNLKDSDDCWSEVNFDISSPVEEILVNLNVKYDVAPDGNINDPSVIKYIKARDEKVFVYSGFGGAILRNPVLSTGKKFLHVHGGYLPKYKGSTTNYFSLLSDGEMGASAIFLTEDIDSGPILFRKIFPAPPDREKIDHIYDSAARAKVLIEVLRGYKTSGTFDIVTENSGGDTYYVIHPVLKHIAILGKSCGEVEA